MTQNQIAYAKLQEEVRTNTANEAIRRRANEIADYGNTLKEASLYTDRVNAETNRMQAEANRQKIENDYILTSARISNDARIAEAQIAQKQAEMAQQYLIESARQAETQRHNTATETEAVTARETNKQISSTQTRAGILNNLLNLGGRLAGLIAK
jgi:hypothetical protein